MTDNGGDHNGGDHNGGRDTGDQHHAGDNGHHNGGDHNTIGVKSADNGAGGGGNGLGDHANTGGQVTKVPVGSVDTGDGSDTAGIGLVYYLVAGALMLAGAGAGVTRRLRRES